MIRVFFSSSFFLLFFLSLSPSLFPLTLFLFALAIIFLAFWSGALGVLILLVASLLAFEATGFAFGFCRFPIGSLQVRDPLDQIGLAHLGSAFNA